MTYGDRKPERIRFEHRYPADLTISMRSWWPRTCVSSTTFRP